MRYNKPILKSVKVIELKGFIPEQLNKFAETLTYPLYVVGGSVRDFLAGHARVQAHFSDWDICAPVPFERFVSDAKQAGFFIHSQFKNTGTVKLSDNSGAVYEFSAFRSDEYVRGEHTPCAVYFTEDITLDAKRRDFTCNAVYYDIKNTLIVDPLGGVEDIKNKTVRTVRESSKVFGEDGLRLMRLARFCGQLGFTPDKDTLKGAQEHAALICDIVPERVFTELNAILTADLKHGVKDGHYIGLQVLEKSGVLDYILPELTLGRGMEQPIVYHNYDVLQHSLRCALYAPPTLRWAALLHDIGKPYCKIEEGNFHRHHEEGARIASEVLTRLKAPNRLKDSTHALILQHMYDMECIVKERKLRRYLVENYAILPNLLSLKQAGFPACKDDTAIAPTVARWQELLTRMQAEGVPFTQKQLKVTGKRLASENIPAAYLGKVLYGLLMHCACAPQDNQTERLLKLSHGVYNNLLFHTLNPQK